MAINKYYNTAGKLTSLRVVGQHNVDGKAVQRHRVFKIADTSPREANNLANELNLLWKNERRLELLRLKLNSHRPTPLHIVTGFKVDISKIRTKDGRVYANPFILISRYGEFANKGASCISEGVYDANYKLGVKYFIEARDLPTEYADEITEKMMSLKPSRELINKYTLAKARELGITPKLIYGALDRLSWWEDYIIGTGEFALYDMLVARYRLAARDGMDEGIYKAMTAAINNTPDENTSMVSHKFIAYVTEQHNLKMAGEL